MSEFKPEQLDSWRLRRHDSAIGKRTTIVSRISISALALVGAGAAVVYYLTS